MNNQALARSVFGVLAVLTSALIGALVGAVIGAIRGPFYILNNFSIEEPAIQQPTETKEPTDRI